MRRQTARGKIRLIITDKARAKGGGREKVSVLQYQRQKLKLEETEASHTLGERGWRERLLYHLAD